MALSRAWILSALSALALMFAAGTSPVAGGRMADKLEILWGQTRLLNDRNGDQTIGLTMDKAMGSAFGSKTSYLFARIDISIKLVPKNSAGTVTTIYLISQKDWKKHDEIDLEFLGNATGQPYTLHTNIFAAGEGGREVQFRLWFDPTVAFHTYSIFWNKDQILILVDGIPIRQFKNHWEDGVPFPVYQPMRLFGCLWDADDWATQGGRIKTDWSQAPFVAYFANYSASGCTPSAGGSWTCGQDPSVSGSGSSGRGDWVTPGQRKGLNDDMKQQKLMKKMQSKYMIYDYCTDHKRFPNGFPKECGLA
ncbi:probable xyloglucan endotransglucosylase/hydrolase protein 25 [Lolium rigidum]|uniref:probable xyloglucan endotransglucosylase/hydrolase protein 25 n=1 Tax=Lolium rigidum TaxID=89674 RepID=UPI001F5C7060|nr:probable xyloglucan endotransglucosylase/hydrolase protein 25 [Lolium rigidum]